METKSALARKSGVLPVNDLMESGMTVCAARFGSIRRGRVTQERAFVYRARRHDEARVG